MCEETKAIEEMVDDMIVQARRMRNTECQANAHLGFIYYQGCIDMGTDIIDAISKIKKEHRNDGATTEVA